MTELSIAAEEFNLRHERVQAFLRENHLGALLAFSPPAEHKWTQTGHVAYLSGWSNYDRIVDSVVVVPTEAGTTVVVHSVFTLPGSGKMFVPLGDVCHITPDGPEFLMNFTRDLFLAGA